MPQNANQATVFKNSSNAQAQPTLDAAGNVPVNDGLLNPSAKTLFNITTATAVKATAGRIIQAFVQVAGSGTGTINDIATTGAAAIGNQIAVIPQTVGGIAGVKDWQTQTGIVVVPGTGQTIVVNYV